MKHLHAIFIVLCSVLLCLISSSPTLLAQQEDIPPTVALIGPVPTVVPCGGNYFEFGANAFDNEDGILEVQIGGDCVCTSMAGSYVVVYTAIDSNGSCTTEERLVIIQGSCDTPCEDLECGVGIPCTGGAVLEAIDDLAQTQLDIPVQIPVLANDIGGANISVNSIIDSPEFGTATILPDGLIEYQAIPGFTGIDEFTYELVRGIAIDTGRVTVAVGVRLNRIEGHIFKDGNDDCLQQTDEIPLSGWLVKVEPGPVYAITDENGFYTLYVDEGDYTVSQPVMKDYWESDCPSPNEYAVSFESLGETSTGNDFANKALFECPLLDVSIGTFLLRNCQENTYRVNYCNSGTVAAEDAYVTMQFDEELIVQSSSLPFTVENGLYTFGLGTIEAGFCGQFSVINSVVCDVDNLGKTVCVEAHIYPDEICNFNNTEWDLSSIEVEGTCANDEVVFTITNVGEGDMSTESLYRVFKRNSLFETANFQLLSGESIQLTYSEGGATMRVEAFQSFGHPGNSLPNTFVEACGGPLETGWANSVGHDDMNPFVDIDCREIIGSYDPNDKHVFPRGVGQERFVHPEEMLEYLIRFQNTGSDTAFKVVIIDTLQKQLDIETVRSGAGSHPYQFEILGNNVLKWTFDNILLPDSTTNELESHGFIKFHIRMIDGVDEGTLLSNRAGIYFDFNEPVITDPSVIKISEKARDFDTYIHTITNLPSLQLYPNPASSTFTIDLGTDLATKQNVELLLFNTLGQLQSQQTIHSIGQSTIDIAQFPEGLYIFQLKAEGNILANGKLLVE